MLFKVCKYPLVLGSVVFSESEMSVGIGRKENALVRASKRTLETNNLSFRNVFFFINIAIDLVRWLGFFCMSASRMR